MLKGDGGHFFISGSHKPSLADIANEKFRIGRIHDEVVKSRYDESRHEFIGEAGTVIVEDTFGLHKGQTPVNTLD